MHRSHLVALLSGGVLVMSAAVCDSETNNNLPPATGPGPTTTGTAGDGGAGGGMGGAGGGGTGGDINVEGPFLCDCIGACPTHVWSHRFGDSGSERGDSVATDSQGNVIVSGVFEGDIDFGGEVLSAAGDQGLFVVKLDADGNHVWSHAWGGNVGRTDNRLAIDGGDNIVVVGDYTGNLDLGGGLLLNAGGEDMFVLKLNAAGEHQWSQSFGNDAIGDDDEGARSVSIDSADNILVTGKIDGQVDFGGGLRGANGDATAALVKLDAAGTHVWSQAFGDSGSVVLAGPGDDLVVVGSAAANQDLGGGPLGDPGFVAHFDASGAHQWSEGFASDQLGLNWGARDTSGGVVIAGPALAANFGGGAIDGAVAKLDNTGSHLWSLAIEPGPVAVDGSNGVFVVGAFGGTTDFGGGPLTATGGTDVFLAQFDAAGAHVGSICYGNPGNQTAEAVATDAAGNIIIVGRMQEGMSFGGDTLVSAGDDDVFITKLAP